MNLCLGLAILLGLAVVFGFVEARGAEPLYCTGQRITDSFGVLYYPNGQRVADSFGREQYPNGQRLKNDFGDEIYYPTGTRVRNSSGDLLYPSGQRVRDSFGVVYYPTGQRTRDSFGKCYYDTGVEMTPCQRVVLVRDLQPRGETLHHRLDTQAGTIDLQNVSLEFTSPSNPLVNVTILVSADLSKGIVNRQSITASCGIRR